MILAIKRDGATLSGLPDPNDLVKPGDVVTAYGKDSDLQRMTETSGAPDHPSPARSTKM